MDEALAPHLAVGPAVSPLGGIAGSGAGRFVLAVGLAGWVALPLLALARTSWTTEAGALGPLILATGIWMLARELRRAAPAARPGDLPIALALLVPTVLAYVAAQAIMMVTLLSLAAWAGLVIVLYGLTGVRATRMCWFPLLYLLLLVPLPYGISVTATAALRGWLSIHAVSLASLFGMEVAVDGNSVFVDQYQLAVEAACAGLNSTISLLSVGLLYAYGLRGAGIVRVGLVVAAAVPIAILCNLLRILVLLVAVHAGGSGVLATPIHPISGFVSFALAFAILALCDRGVSTVRSRAA
jgi:exosortase